MQPSLTVSQLVGLLREVIENHDFIYDLWLQGEVSNYSNSALGHRYFSLKDERSVIRCVLFRDELPGVELKVGDHVIAHGRVSVYVQRGELQFIPDFVRPEGVGLLAAQFEQLKERLGKEGLFDVARKRPLPMYPTRIGVVTSRTGAALQDIKNVLARRWPLAQVLFAPAVVQGEQAAPWIVAALRTLARQEPPLDVAIVARGGGSMEDLWPFNDERVARAIYGFPAPIVSGVGHETDVTIADMVADLRAPTPSAAAERCTPDIAGVQGAVVRMNVAMVSALAGTLISDRAQIAGQAERIVRAGPPIAGHRARVDGWAQSVRTSAAADVATASARLAAAQSHLEAVNPFAVLRRGFAIVQKEGTKRRPVVTSVRKVKGGDRLAISLEDGAFWAEVS
jgi:exodeoxyribonuclease VII large subunit